MLPENILFNAVYLQSLRCLLLPVRKWHINCTLKGSSPKFNVRSRGTGLSHCWRFLGVVFLGTCEIGLALPVEPPNAHNLDREGASWGLPVQKDDLEDY
jgi:hypothetical protein